MTGVSEYAQFLEHKQRSAKVTGRTIAETDVNPLLHPWQRRIVTWAVQTGRAAIWADTGLGKTWIQLEAARLASDRTLVVAPLAVCHQTIREASRLGIAASYVRSDTDADGPGIWVTNYEMALRFDPSKLDAVVLDEASILKQSDGKTRTALIRHFADVQYRFACTATPAPNDIEELTNQAEFLGVMPRTEMLAAYFVHDDEGWRLKGHARRPMFRWMASWAVALTHPSDIGGSDEGYVLPGYDIRPHLLAVDAVPEDQLFATDLGGVGGRAAVRRMTLAARCERTAALAAAEPGEPWVIWCGLNAEADLLTRLIPGAVNVHGSMTPEEKAAGLLGFADGQIRVLVTKPSVASFGMNWQHCARMAFCGLSDSFESLYQAIRRCHRYGQHRLVHVHIILSQLESQIAANVARKERQAAQMTTELVREMRAAGELMIR
jgi:Helicase conserved C-terminal domain/DEAD/DEAH box helicase